MSTLRIVDLKARAGDAEILHGIDLEVGSGEVHVVMGPNGAGKSTLSHVLMGKPGYEITGGTVTLDDVDLLSLPTHERAKAGLFLAMQYPTEVPGVSLLDMLASSDAVADVDDLEARLQSEAKRIGLDPSLLERPLNVDMSGGEKKRNETVQLGMLGPKVAVLDELDSGLDIDALRDVSRRVEELTEETGLGVLAITHYTRVLNELKADRIHVLVNGKIVASGGPELADQLEKTGYTQYLPETEAAGASSGGASDPFADPFADPLAGL